MATLEVESIPGSRFLSQAMVDELLRKNGALIQDNPSHNYRVLGRVGEGGFAKVFRV